MARVSLASEIGPHPDHHLTPAKTVHHLCTARVPRSPTALNTDHGSTPSIIQTSAGAFPMKETNEYYRWRPGFHVAPRMSWVNDPCAPGYSSGLYHLSFQWNPENWEWGNISWGYAYSRDLVHWKVSSKPSIRPSGDQDPCGVFTGCMWPTDIQGVADSSITCFYTSAQHLPIHWTRDYIEGSELLRIATSDDGGRTWQRNPTPSLVPGPPEDIDVTAWRDPFVGRWPSVDQCLGRDPGRFMYGILAGGIRGNSPTAFLYSIDAHDLTKWDYIGVLLTPGLNFAPSSRLPDFGTNWEVTNFLTLQDNLQSKHDVLLMSVEGVIDNHYVLPMQYRKDRCRQRAIRRTRSDHMQNWICGSLLRSTEPTNIQENGDDVGQPSSPVSFDFQFGGCLDFGCFYAANSFYDPTSNARIVHGWVMEEDLPLQLQAKQQWSGLLAVPRVLGMQCIQNVMSCSGVTDISCLDWIHCSPEPSGTYTMTFLTSSPDPRLSTLRQEGKKLPNLPTVLYTNVDDEEDPSTLLLEAKYLEIRASFSVSDTSARVGLIMYHSAGITESLELPYV